MVDPSCAILAIFLCSVVHFMIIWIVMVEMGKKADDNEDETPIFKFIVVYFVTILKSIYGILAKKKRWMMSHLTIQFVVLLLLVSYVALLPFYGPPSSIIDPFLPCSDSDCADQNVLTDKHQIIIFLATQCGISVGILLPFFIISVKCYRQISRENAEPVPYEPLRIDHSSAEIPQQTPEQPHKANALCAIPLPEPNPGEN